ncbi:hypothetical protein OY671_007821, partial [Metschnikowia pulcherrima]
NGRRGCRPAGRESRRSANRGRSFRQRPYLHAHRSEDCHGRARRQDRLVRYAHARAAGDRSQGPDRPARPVRHARPPDPAGQGRRRSSPGTAGRQRGQTARTRRRLRQAGEARRMGDRRAVAGLAAGRHADRRRDARRDFSRQPADAVRCQRPQRVGQFQSARRRRDQRHNAHPRRRDHRARCGGQADRRAARECGHRAAQHGARPQRGRSGRSAADSQQGDAGARHHRLRGSAARHHQRARLCPARRRGRAGAARARSHVGPRPGTDRPAPPLCPAGPGNGSRQDDPRWRAHGFAHSGDAGALCRRGGVRRCGPGKG